MSEHSGRSPDQAGDRDKDSDKDALSTQRETPPAIDNDSDTAPSRQRQADQESALERWETEGGAEQGREEGAEDRIDGNEVAEIGRTDAESNTDDALPIAEARTKNARTEHGQRFRKSPAWWLGRPRAGAR